MTPSGIWSSVNAKLNASRRRSPSVVASAVTTTNVICVAPRPIARGAMSASALRACGSRASIRGRVAEAEPRQRTELDEQVAERARDDADRPARRRRAMARGAARRR